MTAKLLAPLVIAAMLVLTTCGGDSSPEGTATATPTVTLTATPAVPPAAPRLDEAEGPVVVYATPFNQRRDLAMADYDIHAVDSATGQELARLTVPGVFAIPGGMQLQGTRLYASHLDRIAWYDLESGGSGGLVSPAEGDEILSFALSDNGARVAYWRSPEGYESAEQSVMSLVLADVASGQAFAEVESFGTFPDGSPVQAVDAFGQHVAWMPDGDSVLVNTGSSHQRDTMKVGLDGTVSDVLPETDIYWGTPAIVAPSRTTALYPVSSFGAGCPAATPSMTKGIADLVSGEPIWSAPTDREMWAAYGSPDGQSFLYAEFDCPVPDQTERHWRVVTTAGPDAVEAPDPLAILREWYGDRLVYGRCGGTPILPGNDAFLGGWGIGPSTEEGQCTEPVELLVGSMVVASLPPGDDATFYVLGFVEP